MKAAAGSKFHTVQDMSCSSAQAWSLGQSSSMACPSVQWAMRSGLATAIACSLQFNRGANNQTVQVLSMSALWSDDDPKQSRPHPPTSKYMARIINQHSSLTLQHFTRLITTMWPQCSHFKIATTHRPTPYSQTIQFTFHRPPKTHAFLKRHNDVERLI